jgi:hypothetical protein
MIAASHGFLEACDLLIHSNAEINKSNKVPLRFYSLKSDEIALQEGVTPLDVASYMHHDEVVQLIRDK